MWHDTESPFLLLWLGVAQLVLATVLTLSAIVKLAIATRPMAQDWPLYSGPMVGGVFLDLGCLALIMFQVLFTSFIMLFYSWSVNGKNQRIYPSHWMFRITSRLKVDRCKS